MQQCSEPLTADTRHSRRTPSALEFDEDLDAHHLDAHSQFFIVYCMFLSRRSGALGPQRAAEPDRWRTCCGAFHGLRTQHPDGLTSRNCGPSACQFLKHLATVWGLMPLCLRREQVLVLGVVGRSRGGEGRGLRGAPASSFPVCYSPGNESHPRGTALV